MEVQVLDLTSLTPYKNNPRNNAEAVDKVAESIKQFGFKVPLVVDKDNVIVAGHTRYLAAQKLGYDRLPCVVADDLTDEQIKAYRLADNKVAEFAEWDFEKLEAELEALAAFDMSVFGFEELELEIIETEQDDIVPEEPEEPTAKMGNIYRLGEHRLICGDCTRLADMERLMGNDRASMVFTDPPYNVNYGATMKDKLRGTDRTIKNDNLGDGFGLFLTDSLTNLMKFNDGAAYVCMSSSELHTLYNSFIAAGGKWSTFIIWAKNTFTLGRSDYQRQYEPILYGWGKDKKHYWCGDRNQSDVWEYNKPLKNDLHPTMKPVELVERAILNSSQKGEIVLDGFGGGGSTLIAAEKTGRKARLIELDPKFVDVIVKRWEDFTGQKAELICGEA